MDDIRYSYEGNYGATKVSPEERVVEPEAVFERREPMSYVRYLKTSSNGL